jgi:hypothetical protein
VAVGDGGALLLCGGVARAQTRADVDVLNYALVLEYLQAAFYTEAERSKAITGKAGTAAKKVGAVERAHVTAFRDILGSRAVKRPTFDFEGVTEQPRAFLRTAVAFEDLAVAAYKGEAPKLETPQIITSALGIHTVEARHAAWMRTSTASVRRRRRSTSRAAGRRSTGSSRRPGSPCRLRRRSNRAPRYTGWRRGAPPRPGSPPAPRSASR